MHPIRVAAVLGMLALLPAAAEAQTTITACYVPNSGSVYRIKAAGTPSSCKQNHVQFSWETDVAVDYNIRPGIPNGQPFAPDQTMTFTAHCQGGEVAVGGGFSVGGPVLMVAEGPIPGNQGWSVTLRNPGPIPYFTVGVRAICLALPS